MSIQGSLKYPEEGVLMRSETKSVEDYLDSLDPKWKDMVVRLREIILKNIPEGFQETMTYGMLGWVVPHSIYPKGYHAKPEEPLPFISLAAQKNTVSLYHMGIYGDDGLLDWFKEGYQNEVGKKPNMGKSCIRFRKEEDIPFQLLEELLHKVTVEDYIEAYEYSMKK